jgi:hypothetical protein
MADLTQYVQMQAPNNQLIVDTIMYIGIGVVVSILIFIMLRFATCKILVERCYKLKSGWVIKTGRYKEVWDKDLKLKYLVPIFGGERLPGFPSEGFQKVWGFPVFGVQRHLTLIFPAAKSPIVVIPRAGEGEYKSYSTIRHYVKWEDQQFIKKFKRQGLLMQAADIAPYVIIIGSIAFWAYTMFLQSTIIEKIGENVDNMGNAIKGMLEGGK